MGQEIRGLAFFEQDGLYELDESIVRLKALIERLDVETVVNPTSESIEVTFEIVSLIRNMNTPVRMTNEGIA